MSNLVAEGFRVGIIEQIECRNSENRKIFKRELKKIITVSTLGLYCQAMDQNLQNYAQGVVFSIYQDEFGNLGLTILKVFQGALFWDQFLGDDLVHKTRKIRGLNSLCDWLSFFLYRFQPTEIIYQANSLNRSTLNLLESLQKTFRFQIEECSHLSREELDTSHLLTDAIIETSNYSRSVVISLTNLLHYCSMLKIELSFDTMLKITPFEKVAQKVFLSNPVIHSLTLSSNSSSMDFTLLKFLDNCYTGYGRSKLRQWILNPLRDIKSIEDRISASECVHKLRIASLEFSELLEILKKSHNVSLSLGRIKSKCISPSELKKTGLFFLNLGGKLQEILLSKNDLLSDSPYLKDLFFQLCSHLCEISNELLHIVDILNEDAVLNYGTRQFAFKDYSKFPNLCKCFEKIIEIESELEGDLLHASREVLGMPNLLYSSFYKDRYLLEVPADKLHLIPLDWSHHASNNKFNRFQSPEILRKVRELEEWETKALLENSTCWGKFLTEFAANEGCFAGIFSSMLFIVEQLSVLDCLQSLAILIDHSEFCRPQFKDAFGVQARGLRHPIAFYKKYYDSKSYIPNDCYLSPYGKFCLLLTGPNSGGKSSFLRALELAVIMAQIGCYVPAASMCLSPFDSIWMRSGVHDEILTGKSTFFVESSEMSAILKHASSNSLVLIDEFGRGTSTFDGFSLAYAVMHHILTTIKCCSVFVSHFLDLKHMMENFPENLKAQYMSYILQARPSMAEKVVFTFQLKDGICPFSFGIEIARKAGLPPKVLERAEKIAKGFARHDLLRRQMHNSQESHGEND